MDATASHDSRPVLLEALAKGPTDAAGLNMGTAEVEHLDGAPIFRVWRRCLEEQSIPVVQELREVFRAMEGSIHGSKPKQVVVPVRIPPLPERSRCTRF